MPFRASPATVDIAARLIALDLGLHPSHVRIDLGNGPGPLIAQVIVIHPAQHRSWRDDHGGMILTRTRALLMAIQDDHTDLAERRRSLKRAITRALEEPATEEWRNDPTTRPSPSNATWKQELGAVVAKCAYPAPHPRHRHMGRNRTAVWCPGVPARCGATNPDYPGEYACTLDAGHPVPIRLPDHEDVIECDHANPERSAYWSGWTEADYFPTTRPSPSNATWKGGSILGGWADELGAEVADSSDPDEKRVIRDEQGRIITRLRPTCTCQDCQEPEADSRQTCTACHGTGEMHDLSHGVMACDRCNGDGYILPEEQEEKAAEHEPTGLELGAEVGSPEKSAGASGNVDNHPSTPPSIREARARMLAQFTDEELFEYLAERLAAKHIHLAMTPLQSPEKATQSDEERPTPPPCPECGGTVSHVSDRCSLWREMAHVGEEQDR